MSATAPPDAILARPALLARTPGYAVRLLGERNGKTDEGVALLSIGPFVEQDSVGLVSIGAVDILGKQGMDEFVGSLFRPAPQLKRVTKVEDLLPLLNFGMARAVVVFPTDIEYLGRLSTARFTVTYLPEARTGIVALGVRRDEKESVIISSVKSMPSAILRELGIDKWKQQ
jgi:hypothetical protein